MITNIAEYEVVCRFRDNGVHCQGGILYNNVPIPEEDDPDGNEGTYYAAATLDGEPLPCGACKGTGFILTRAGEQLVELLWRHLEPRVKDEIHAQLFYN